MKIRVKGDIVHIEGYVNAVERLSKVLTDRFGNFRERIKANAFREALKENSDVRILLNHNWDRELGGQADGNLELYEDAIGLHARAVIEDHEVAEDARRGDLVGWSFGFMDKEGGVDITEEGGLPVRNVSGLDLYEVSLLNRKAVPAYDGTLVCVRADGKGVNVGAIEELDSEVEIEDEEEVIEEAKEEEVKEEPAEEEQVRGEEVEEKKDNELADDNGAVDYTKYKDIIAEMKGE